MSKIEFSEETKKALLDAIGFCPSAKKIVTGTIGLGGRYRNGIELECGANFTVTFDRLKKVSAIFGTDKIDVNNYVYQGGYCETCSYEEAQISLQIYEPTKGVPEGFW